MKTVMTVIVFIIGVGFFIAMGDSCMRQRWFKESAKTTTGKVVGYDEHYSDDTRMYAPIFRYEVDGKSYEKKSSLSSSSPQYAIGQQVHILYAPNQPDNGVDDSAQTLYFEAAILGFFGFIFSCVGLVLFFMPQ